eukprot:m.173962 g.173962  ORF g.173962 m.173962 type:complete len:217 (-) comp15313_c4_seq7:139-789(-)
MRCEATGAHGDHPMVRLCRPGLHARAHGRHPFAHGHWFGRRSHGGCPRRGAWAQGDETAASRAEGGEPGVTGPEQRHHGHHHGHGHGHGHGPHHGHGRHGPGGFFPPHMFAGFGGGVPGPFPFPAGAPFGFGGGRCGRFGRPDVSEAARAAAAPTSTPTPAPAPAPTPAPAAPASLSPEAQLLRDMGFELDERAVQALLQQYGGDMASLIAHLCAE